MAGPAQAEAAVKAGDKLRASFIESFYGVSCDSARAFDLGLDASKIPTGLATSTICEAARALLRQPAGAARLASLIDADLVLASAVSYELRCEIDHNAQASSRGPGGRVSCP